MSFQESAVSAACEPVRADEIENKDAEGVLASGQIGQAYFGAVGQAVHDMGWAVYPQEREGRRMPSRINGEVVKWSLYQGGRVDQSTLDKWLIQARHANLAVIMGPSSSNALAIDIDVTDDDLSFRVEALTERILGKTRFKRIGSHPKIMLFYRLAEEASFTKRTLRLSEAEDPTRASPHMVEILAKQSTATFYGRHHVTGGAFRWFKPPTRHSPLELPLITEEQLAAYEVELGELRALYKPAAAIGANEFAGVEAVEAGGVRIARMRVGLARNAEGLVEDGREDLLARLVYDQLASNAFDDRPTKFSPDQIAAFKGAIFDKTVRHFAASQGQIDWSKESAVRRLIAGKVKFLQPKFALDNTHVGKKRGYRQAKLDIDPSDLMKIPESVWDRAPGSPLTGLINKAFRPRLDERAGFALADDVSHSMADIALRAHERRPRDQDERDKIGVIATIQIRTAVTDWFWACIAKDEEARKKAFVVVKAATGAGKTVIVSTTLLALIEENEDKLADEDVFLFAVPSHKNADGVVAAIERQKKQLAGGGEEQRYGVLRPRRPDNSLTPIPHFRPERPQVGVVLGKNAAGCQFGEILDAAEEIEAHSSRVCATWVDGKDRKDDDVECAIRAAGLCAYYRLEQLNRYSRLLIIPRLYLSSNAPAWFKRRNVLGTIIDEDPVPLFLKDYRLAISTMLGDRSGDKVVLAPRGRPSRKNPKTPVELSPAVASQIRRRLIHLVYEALANGEGAAKRVRFHSEIVGGVKWDPALMIRAASACCRKAEGDALMLRPFTGDAQNRGAIEKFKAGLKQKLAPDSGGVRINTGVVAERKLIAHLKDMLAKDPIFYRDEQDARLQLRREDAEAERLATVKGGTAPRWTQLRISQRLDPRLCDGPVLLLDASAQPVLLTKVFGREPHVIDVDTVLHLVTAACFDSTFSNYKILPRLGEDNAALQAKLDLRRDLRLFITAVAHHFKGGRVLVVTTKKVRNWLNRRDWACPQSIDWMHFGALRGLDGAKEHCAMVSIGRSEQPIDVIDALAAGVGFDDESPYKPFDRLGSLKTEDGKDLFRDEEYRELRMRKGWTLKRKVPVMPAGRARQIEQAWREEELRQAAGRLRPIHRFGPAPVWLALGTSTPADFVIDEVFRWKDVVAQSKAAEMARIAGEITSDKPSLDNDLKDEDPLPDHTTRLMLERRLDRARRTYSNYSYENALWCVDILDWRLEFFPKFGAALETIALLGTNAECKSIDHLWDLDDQIMAQMQAPGYTGIVRMRPTREEALTI